MPVHNNSNGYDEELATKVDLATRLNLEIPKINDGVTALRSRIQPKSATDKETTTSGEKEIKPAPHSPSEPTVKKKINE